MTTPVIKTLNDTSIYRWDKINIFKSADADNEDKIEELDSEATKCTDKFD